MLLGLRVSRGAMSSKRFFVGDRGCGKAIMIAQAPGTGTHADQAVGVADAAYITGTMGAVSQHMKFIFLDRATSSGSSWIRRGAPRPSLP